MTLEHFAHIVSHDLKGPLHGIASMVEFVVEDYGDRLDEPGREQLAMIQGLAGRAVAMIDALRRYSRVATADIRRRPLDLTAVVSRVVAEVARRHPHWTAVTEIAPLPTVAGDPALVPLLFDALIDNALRYSDRTSRRVSVTSWRPEDLVADGMVAIAVSDDGIGVPDRHRAEVFTMFKRLHAPDAYGGGIGAGLTVAQCIAERHGGRIWLEAQGPGTTVVVTLPRSADAVRAGAAE